MYDKVLNYATQSDTDEDTDSDEEDGMLDIMESALDTDILEATRSKKKLLEAEVVDDLTPIKIIRDGKKKTVIQAHQHDNYRYRGPELKDLSLYEYISSINQIRKPNNDDTSDTSTKKRRGRTKHSHINYAEGHPLEKTHCQVQRSQLLITMLTGARRPKPPKPQTRRSSKSSKQQAKRFALYVFISVHFVFLNSVPLFKEP